MPIATRMAAFPKYRLGTPAVWGNRLDPKGPLPRGCGSVAGAPSALLELRRVCPTGSRRTSRDRRFSRKIVNNTLPRFVAFRLSGDEVFVSH